MSSKGAASGFLYTLEQIVKERKAASAEDSYTAKLYAKGLDKILQKVGEESVEYIIDAKNNNKERAVSEAADLLYHLMVSFQVVGISLSDIDAELARRHQTP